MIREMQPEDLEGVIALIAVLHIETPYRQIEMDWHGIIAFLTAAQMRRTALILVAEHEGKITGLMLGKVEPFWFADQAAGARVASDLVFYSRFAGDGPRMLRRFIAWAFSVPRVVRIEMAVSTGQADLGRMAKIYERVGLRQEGSLFVMNHPMYQQILDDTVGPKMAEVV